MRENSARHKSSILSMKTRSAIDGRLDNLLQVQIDEEITYWRNVLKRVVAVVKRLCSRGLAFRGKNEKFGDPHNGNYYTAHVDQLTLVIRYVLESGEPCERFLKFLPSVGHKADEMFSDIISELETLGINIQDCRGLSYDNAANMSGLYNGLQAKIRNQAPFALYVPCSAHCLNLVAIAAAESCSEACRFFITLQEIYVFFVNSTQRWLKLMSEIGKGETLKRVNLTRWSAREDTC
ncbi:Zinc finger MYM-type protein 1 [Eumeta japonica]|uniref:Zinc finger MYM-type protein 1 n=1 Tax=Eumeta variegata TaxID=151549 RepID=A0A4C1ZST1_EUMVA|nr:Zinc finger MYM-type protein 1 [Eumeta japonica]